MKESVFATLSALAIVPLMSSSLMAQMYSPDNWIIDPFGAGHDPNYSISGGNTTSQVFTDNGTALGDLYGYSLIGSTLSLVNPGNNITLFGTMTLSGNVADADNQFRFGLLYSGNSANDTGWLGYDIGLPTSISSPSLYLRNNPNTGVFASSTGATVTSIGNTGFGGSLVPGTYDLIFSITLTTPTSETINWSVTEGGSYYFTGSYINNDLTTEGGVNFDSVGFLAGASGFSSASTSDAISFSGLNVTFTSGVPEPTTFAMFGMGLVALLATQVHRRKS